MVENGLEEVNIANGYIIENVSATVHLHDCKNHPPYVTSARDQGDPTLRRGRLNTWKLETDASRQI